MIRKTDDDTRHAGAGDYPVDPVALTNASYVTLQLTSLLGLGKLLFTVTRYALSQIHHRCHLYVSSNSNTSSEALSSHKAQGLAWTQLERGTDTDVHGLAANIWVCFVVLLVAGGAADRPRISIASSQLVSLLVTR